MNLNFWQWLGVVLLVVASAFWIMRQRNQSKQAEFGAPSMIYTEEEPTTDSATEPTMEPMTEPTTKPAAG